MTAAATPGGADPRRSTIDPRAYADPGVFAAEADAIFGSAWVFAGLTDDLARADDYVTLELPGRSVVIQNFAGELRALHNVCPHRFGPIQAGPRGNRWPRCLYHGWVFDGDGVPTGIPENQAQFRLDAAARRALAVPVFSLECCGRFVFVRLAADGPSLADWLGPLGPHLEALSAAFTVPFAEDRFDWAANWKLGVESVLEVYHAAAVHPDSFSRFVDRGWQCSEHGDHSRGIAPISAAARQWWDGVAGRTGLARTDRIEDYDHVFAFPNLAVGVTGGAVMSVQSYLPLGGPDACRLVARLFRAPTTGRAAFARAVEAEVARFNRTVLDEDRRVSEQVHHGARQATAPALLGDQEGRIRAFHAAWSRHLAAGAGPGPATVRSDAPAA